MSSALAWVAGPDAERVEALFRYVVRVDRDTASTIARRAKAAGMSPDRYVQTLFDAALQGPAPAAVAGAAPGKTARVARAAIDAFARRHGLTFSQGQVFAVLQEMAVDGVAAPVTADVAARVGVSGWTVNTAFAKLEAVGLVARLPRPGRTYLFEIKAELR